MDPARLIPAAEAILAHPDFANGIHSTKWVEERLDLSELSVTPQESGEVAESVLRSVTAEVAGRRYEVKVWLPEAQQSAGNGAGKAAAKRRGSAKSVTTGRTGSVAVPMQGTIVKMMVEVGDAVEEGQTLCVLEAMKMENEVKATMAGTVTQVKVSTGDAVTGGDVVIVIE